MPAPLDCPGIECWQLLFREGAPLDQRESYERHLESCAFCQERLDQAEECADAVRRLGQQVGDPTVVTADPTLVRVLQRLREMHCADSAGTREPADLFFLRSTDRPELLGTFGDYDVLEVIGQGGMGIVLKAYEPALHRLVAIKVLSPTLAGSATARRRFTREAKAAAAVCDEHIVAVHGVSEVDGLPYLVMQYIGGESLQERLNRQGALAVAEIVRIGLQTAAGLAAAHAQGLIHRDIKPANLLLENGVERVKITDFGLARMADDVGLTQNGVVAGTPEYMAPEQARGETIDHRADLFSLGSVLYALCTGAPPWRGSTAAAVLRQVIDQAATPVRSLNPDVPAWLESVIHRLLAKAPDDRFQSAAEVAALLRGYLAHLNMPASVPLPELLPSPPGDSTRRRGRSASRRVALSGYLLAALLLIALGLGLVLRFAGSAGEPKAETKLRREYDRSLKGNQEDNQGLELHGPDADKCVRFEATGLRFTLPTGYPGERQNTGVSTGLAVKGDFEITVSFEILKEPDLDDAGKAGTRLHLSVILEKPQKNAAGLTWVAAKWGRKFSAWSNRWDEDTERVKQAVHTIPSTATVGRLRLTRTGATLSYSLAEGANGTFVLFHEHPFSDQDLKDVLLLASTGGPKAMLDARLTDLRIRAESLPESPEPPSVAAAPGFPWKIGLAIALLLALGVGIGLAVRQRRRSGKALVSALSEGEQARPAEKVRAVTFSCPNCGKALKARAEFTGRRFKCPQCAQAVVVPAAGAAESAPPSP